MNAPTRRASSGLPMRETTTLPANSTLAASDTLKGRWHPPDGNIIYGWRLGSPCILSQFFLTMTNADRTVLSRGAKQLL